MFKYLPNDAYYTFDERKSQQFEERNDVPYRPVTSEGTA
jgi:hypothetical protein